MVRINKYLSDCGLGSRRKVEDLITTGKVNINGVKCVDLTRQIDVDKDIVTVNNIVLTYEKKKIFLLLNKPKGYIVTKKDEFNRKTAYKLLPEFASKLHPVGRLDLDSEGLLLLTNDGEITNKLLHPKNKIEKTYKVITSGKVEMHNIINLRKGVEIKTNPPYTTAPAKVFLKNNSEERSELKITIHEGKNRQVRKMIEAIGHEVILLKRVQIGNIKLGKLSTGSWRFLTDLEILMLLKLIKIIR